MSARGNGLMRPVAECLSGQAALEEGPRGSTQGRMSASASVCVCFCAPGAAVLVLVPLEIGPGIEETVQHEATIVGRPSQLPSTKHGG